MFVLFSQTRALPVIVGVGAASIVIVVLAEVGAQPLAPDAIEFQDQIGLDELKALLANASGGKLILRTRRSRSSSSPT